MSLPPAPLSQDSTDLPWIVQKFGRTEVGKFIDTTITSQIVKESMKYNRVAVVCSSGSEYSKLTGSMSRLVRAMELVLSSPPEDDNWLLTIDRILQEHSAVVISHPGLRRTLEQENIHECNRLKPILGTVQALNEISLRSRDAIIEIGERLAAALRDRGMDIIFISLENIIDSMQCSSSSSSSSSRNPHVLDQSFYDRLSNHIAVKVQTRAAHQVPVVTGFFGPLPGSLLTAAGCGYTDLCAALVAMGLGAEKIQTWKEMDRIFAADPCKVKYTPLLPVIPTAEAAEATYCGSQVVHPLTMEYVIRARIPIYTRDVERLYYPGIVTTVANDATTADTGAAIAAVPSLSISSGDTTTGPPSSPELRDDNKEEQDRKLISKCPAAVTIKEGIVVLNIRSNRNKINHVFFAGIFAILDRYCIVVDLFTSSEVQVSMALSLETNRDKDFGQALEELRTFGTVDVNRNMAILTLVGKKMGPMAGVAGVLFTALALAGINIEMISQGASEITLSCVIHKDSAVAALNIVQDRILCEEGIYSRQSE